MQQRFSYASEWLDDRVRISLTNHGDAVSGFRLAIGGPSRIDGTHKLLNATLAGQLSTYAELAPPAGYVLEAGAVWTLEIAGFNAGIRHWTDAAAAAFVILADDSAVPAGLTPIRRGNSPPLLTGTMPLAGTMPSVTVIPWPNRVDVSGSRALPLGFEIAASPARDAFAELTALLFSGETFLATGPGALTVTLADDPALAPEAYRLTFGDTATLSASGHSGFLYGLVTLGQMLRGARAGDGAALPSSGEIADTPANGFRGSHLDVARRFYPVADIERFLGILAWNKLNRFHWHLSDDEAFRVEIEAFPELTDVAAWRGHGLPLQPFLGSGPARSGGFYSKAEIAALVARAARYGIEIIPEIDVPGHCHALQVALPQLRDPGETGAYHSIQVFPNNCLNPAMEPVYEALETIFGEMAEMFPSRYFHVGADEVPDGAWSGSPAAQALGESLGVTGTAPLQAHFLRRIQSFLRGRGKITGAWEEAAHGGGISADGAYLVGWTRVEASREVAAQGYDVVVAPAQAYYLDMANNADWHEPGSAWAGSSSPENTYGYDPVAGWTEAEAAHFMGIQACIWSEPMISPEVFDRLVFPRLSAIAETGWTRSASKDFARFAAVCGLMPNLYGHREKGTAQ